MKNSKQIFYEHFQYEHNLIYYNLFSETRTDQYKKKTSQNWDTTQLLHIYHRF